MPVTSATVQSDLLSYFLAGLPTSVRLPTPLTVVKNWKETQDGDNENAQSAKRYEAKSPSAYLALDVKQRGDGRCYLDIDFAAGTVEEFHALFKQVSDGIANAIARADAQNWRDNALPTLTSMSAPVVSGAANAEVEITLAAIKAQGNEADSDGTVDGFVVAAVSAGSLKIGADAGSATAWAAGTNDTITATKKAYWTIPAGAGGAVNAFTVKALDNDGWLQSTAAVQVQVTRT